MQGNENTYFTIAVLNLKKLIRFSFLLKEKEKNLIPYQRLRSLEWNQSIAFRSALLPALLLVSKSNLSRVISAHIYKGPAP